MLRQLPVWPHSASCVGRIVNRTKVVPSLPSGINALRRPCYPRPCVHDGRSSVPYCRRIRGRVPGQGELVTREEGVARELQLERQGALFFFDCDSHDYCLDATEGGHGGGVGRRINHSRTKPNLRVQALSSIEAPDKRAHLYFSAILPYTALSYDYGDTRRKAPTWLKQ